MIDLLNNLYLQRPLWLLCIPLVLIALGSAILRKSQQGVWAQHIDAHLLKQLTEENSTERRLLTRQHIHIFLAIALSICCIALSGPSWDRVAQPALDNQQRLIIISDMTLSMLATDVKPNRLSQQKFKIRELLKSHRQGHMALIAFSGDAHVVTPFTEDYKAIDNLVSVLSPEIIPSIGSRPESALKLAVELLEKQPGPATIILFTDEILESSAAAMMSVLRDAKKHPQLKDAPISMTVVGIGTKLGSPIKLPSGRFLVDSNNNIVSASLDSQKLKNFSKTIGGNYLQATADNADVDRLRALANASKSQYSQQQETQEEIDTWRDMGGWVALLVVPFFLSIFRKGYILPSFLLIFVGSSYVEPALAQEQVDSNSPQASAKVETVSPWQRLWKTPDQLAQSLYDQEQYQAASDLFEDLSWRGYASAKANDYERATQLFSDALPADSTMDDKEKSTNNQNSPLGPDDLFNLYNRAFSQAHQGLLQEALNDLDNALAVDPDFAEATKAKAIIEDLLEKQEKQQQSEDNQSDDQSSSEQGEDQQGQQSNGEEGEQGEPQQGQDTDDLTQSDNKPSNSENESASSDNEESNSSEDQQNRPTPGSDAENSDHKQSQKEQGVQKENTTEEAKRLEEEKNSENDNDDQTDQEASIVQQNALDAWLNQVEDDPSGLLRRKFEYERSLRQQDGTTVVDNEKSQIW